MEDQNILYVNSYQKKAMQWGLLRLIAVYNPIDF